MGIEEPKPFKNEWGQINDPAIAHSMARSENDYRKHYPPEKQDTIDKLTDLSGAIRHERKNIAFQVQVEQISKKLINTLTKEEIEFLKKYPNDVAKNFSEKK